MPDAFFAPAPYGVVAVAGEDRISFLQNVLTQDVDALQPDGHAGGLYLDARGAPLAMLEVAVVADRILLVTATRELAATVAETLGGRTFLADARFEVLAWVARAIRGSDAAEVAGRAGLSAPRGRVRQQGDVVVLGRDGGLDVIGDERTVNELAARMESAGARPGTAEDLERWRIVAGEPAWGREVRAPHLPEEIGLLPTHVHLQKGCYPGQEAVARMWMLGRPRRRLARVAVAHDVNAGWTAGSGRQQVEVTSVADTANGRVGLAYVPPDAKPGDRYGDEGELTVREMVGEGRPVPGHDPAVRRRRDQRPR